MFTSVINKHFKNLKFITKKRKKMIIKDNDPALDNSSSIEV